MSFDVKIKDDNENFKIMNTYGLKMQRLHMRAKLGFKNQQVCSLFRDLQVH